MEYELMNVSYNLVNGNVIAWRIMRNEESQGTFYMNDNMQICVEGNGETLEEVKNKITALIFKLGSNCNILLKDMEDWESFEALQAKWKLQ